MENTAHCDVTASSEATVVEVQSTFIKCALRVDASSSLTTGTIGQVCGVRYNRKECRSFQVGDIVHVHPYPANPQFLCIDKKYIKPLLIFDIHGVLGERLPFQEGLSKNMGRKVARKFITRPHCEDFLDFCFENYEVGVWSSALKKNLSLSMFGEKGRTPLFVWSQKEITDLFPIMSFRKSTKPLHLKDMSTVWTAYPSYDASNSLLLDNDLEKCARNPFGTLLLVPSFDCNDHEDSVFSLTSPLAAHLRTLAAPVSVTAPEHISENNGEVNEAKDQDKDEICISSGSDTSSGSGSGSSSDSGSGSGSSSGNSEASSVNMADYVAQRGGSEEFFPLASAFQSIRDGILEQEVLLAQRAAAQPPPPPCPPGGSQSQMQSHRPSSSHDQQRGRSGGGGGAGKFKSRSGPQEERQQCTDSYRYNDDARHHYSSGHFSERDDFCNNDYHSPRYDDTRACSSWEGGGGVYHNERDKGDSAGQRGGKGWDRHSSSNNSNSNSNSKNRRSAEYTDYPAPLYSNQDRHSDRRRDVPNNSGWRHEGKEWREERSGRGWEDGKGRRGDRRDYFGQPEGTTPYSPSRPHTSHSFSDWDDSYHGYSYEDGGRDDRHFPHHPCYSRTSRSRSREKPHSMRSRESGNQCNSSRGNQSSSWQHEHSQAPPPPPPPPSCHQHTNGVNRANEGRRDGVGGGRTGNMGRSRSRSRGDGDGDRDGPTQFFLSV